MKFPAQIISIKNYLSLFSVLITIFLGSIFFLLVTPNVTKPASAAACSYSFPASVAAGSTFNVTITGTAGDQFQAGIVNSSLQAVGGNGASVLPMSGSWNLSVTAPNPPIGAPFQLLAGDNTVGGVAGLCAPTSGSTAISITGSTGGVTYAVSVNLTSGCTSLGCVVGSASNIAGTNYTFTNMALLTPNTGYNVFVCSPDCGTGTPLAAWNPHPCTTNADGSLYVDWLTNVCGSSTGGGGGGGNNSTLCTSFSTCLTGIVTPGLKYTQPQGLIGQLLTAIIPVILAIAGFLTVIIIIISGIQFALSSGDPESAAKARGRLIFALIGFIVIILAFAIVKIIDMLFLGTTGVF